MGAENVEENQSQIMECGAPRRWLSILFPSAAAVFCCLFFLWSLLNLGTPGGQTQDNRTDMALMDKYNMYMTNQISDALEGVISVDKVYWLDDYDLIAPEPDQACYGSTTNPEEVLPVLEKAAEMLDIEGFIFRTDVNFHSGSSINWYLDETIFALTWQEIRENCLYTFAEVKIAHPTQMRRFLAGGTYGYGKQFLTTQMSADVNAVVASSGDFYKFRQYGIVVYNGQVHRANGQYVDTCFVDDRGELILVKAGQLTTMEDAQKFVDENHIRFSLSFGPILIQDGELCPPHNYIIGEINDNYPRAALCQAGERHYLLAVANSIRGYYNLPTIHQFARNLEDKGVTTAYTLDGGQTGVIVLNDQMVSPVQYDSQRQISDIFYFATALPDGG